MGDSRKQVLGSLVALCSRLPVPDGRWHPHAEAIAAVRADFEHALQIVGTVPELLDAIDLAGPPQLHLLSEAVGPDLQAAWARLEGLAVPVGRHPFLDEIVPAVDAARVTLAAISRHEVAARRFELAAVAAAA